MSEPTVGRRKVAILGGGCGGLAAAWALTATPELRGRYEVTVYERSWRLGGKGASGRASIPGAAGRRIEEHGLHIWFGFYAHAFRMLRDAYAEAGLADGEDWWRTPFEKCDAVAIYDHAPDGTWARQTIALPAAGGPPPTEPRPFSASRALARASRMVARELTTGFTGAVPTRGGAVAEPGRWAAIDIANALEDAASELERAGSVTPAPRPPDLARRGGSPHDPLDGALRRLRIAVGDLETEIEPAAPDARRGLPHPVRRVSARLRLLAGTADMLAATLNGLRACHGKASEDIDLRAWLKTHGARDVVVDSSPIIRGLYDLTFAYRNGDKRMPDLAAGRALQSLLSMIDYGGAFMWRMRAGMGDVVFTPLYLALRQRGVRFEFFADVTRLGVDRGRPLVDAIELTRTSRVVAGPGDYEPLERVGEWWCWPAQPDDEQLATGPPGAGGETLRRGRDFDDVVLAIGVGALPGICGELAERAPRFRQMLDGAQTVRTKALQLWLTRPIHELRGRAGDPRDLDAPATAYAEPFDTYCDMSHLLGAEHGGVDGPRGVAYFCAVLSDEMPDDEAEAHVRVAAHEYLEQRARAIWPGAFVDDAFDWNVLFDPEDRVGPQRLEAQYVRANVDASDRYVRTPAGEVDHRLGPDDSGFGNLVLAGDWTHNDIDGGCVEAAVISGERAGEAVIRRATAATTKPGLPFYVEYGELATVPVPLVCERLRMIAFIARADPERIRRLCDVALNQPTAGARHYAPHFGHVLLVFSQLSAARSDVASHQGLGSATYREAAIWIPVLGQGQTSLFMPYLWLDDPIAIATGRELYGFAKTQGTIRGFPAAGADGWGPSAIDELCLDRFGLAPAADAATTSTHQLMTVRRAGAATRGGDRAELEDLPALIDHFAGADRGPATRSGRPALRAVEGLNELRVGRFRHVLLKQIRDAEHPERAALQQIVEATSTIDPSVRRRFRRLQSHELEVSMPAGEALVESLGIEARQTMRGFTAEFGFRLGVGKIVWSSG